MAAPDAARVPNIDGSNRAFCAAAAAILIAALAVRVLAGRDGLWLDEIWTLGLLQQVQSSWDILTSLHNENNHYLNTLCLWWIGPQANWITYRIPSMLAGTASVGLAGWIGWRRGIVPGLIAMVLAASSYVLIHYSSEARGYSFAVCFALLTFALHERLVARGSLAIAAGTASSAILGILSQPVFLAFYGAIAAIALWRGACVREKRRALRRRLLACHLPVMAFFLWLYEVDLGQVVNAGGPIYPLHEVVAQTLSLAVGGPDLGPWMPVAAIAATIAYLASLAMLWRCDREFCVASVLIVGVMPALLLWAARRNEIYPRYFLIGIAFYLVTLGLALGRIWSRGSGGKAACIAALAIFLSGNGLHAARLLQWGRGGYLPLIADLEAKTTGREIVVGSDFDFRNEMVLGFYSQYLGDQKRLVYVRQNQWPPEGPEWLLIHSLDRQFHPAPELIDRLRHPFRLVRSYPYSGLSGWAWALYHNRAYSDIRTQVGSPAAPIDNRLPVE